MSIDNPSKSARAKYGLRVRLLFEVKVKLYIYVKQIAVFWRPAKIIVCFELQILEYENDDKKRVTICSVCIFFNYYI